jgi:hypothetical protein
MSVSSINSGVGSLAYLDQNKTQEGNTKQPSPANPININPIS